MSQRHSRGGKKKASATFQLVQRSVLDPEFVGGGSEHTFVRVSNSRGAQSEDGSQPLNPFVERFMTLEEALKAPRQFVDEGDQGTGQCGIHTLEEGDTDEVDVEEWQDGDEDEDEDEEEFFARVRRGSRRRGEEMDSDSAPGGESGEDEEEEEEEDRTRLASLLKPKGSRPLLPGQESQIYDIDEVVDEEILQALLGSDDEGAEVYEGVMEGFDDSDEGEEEFEEEMGAGASSSAPFPGRSHHHHRMEMGEDEQDEFSALDALIQRGGGIVKNKEQCSMYKSVRFVQNEDGEGMVYMDDEGFRVVRGKKSRLRDDGKDWLTVASSNRSAHLRMIDDRFENVIKDYEDELLGQLNSDEEGDALHGELDINAFADQMDEFLADLAPKKVPITEVDSLVREKVRKKAKTQDEAEDANFVDPALLVQDGDREEYDYIKVRRAPEFDCETILSTYSNTENLPTVIKLPAGVRVIGSGKKKIRLRRGVPVVEEEAPGVEESRTSGETKSVDSGSEEEEEGDSAPVETWINKRTRVETKAEKAERKRLAKEIKRAKRQQKKQVKQAFREAQVEHSQVRNRDTYGVSALKFH